MPPTLLAAGLALPPLLVDFALKSTLVLGVATLIAAGLRRSSAAARHAAWGVALGGLLLLAAVRALAPGWSVRVLPAGMAAGAAGRVLARAGGDPAGAPAPLATPVVANDAAPQLPVVRARSNGAPAAWGRWSASSLVLAAWLGVALLLLARLGVAHVRVARLARRGTPATDPRLAVLLPARAAALQMTRPVRVIQAAGIPVPLTWGVRKPVVLLPADTLQWSDARLGAVLTHELAHVARRDALWQCLGQCALALAWFHPLAWLAAARERAECERACDDRVLRLGTRPTDYADDLLAFALRDAQPGAPLAASLAMARRGELEQRLLAILDGATPRHALRRGARIAVGVALGAVALCAVLRPVARAEANADARHLTGTGSLTLNGQRIIIDNWDGDAGISARTWLAQSAAAGAPAGSRSAVLIGQRRTTVRAASRERCLALDLVGDARLSDTGDGFAAQPGSRVLLIERRGGVDREYTLERGRGGKIRESYSESGAAVTPEVKATWLADIIPVVMRQTGLGLMERVRRIRAEQGPGGVLAEARLVTNNAMRQEVLCDLLAEPGLPEALVRDVVTHALTLPESTQRRLVFSAALPQASAALRGQIATAALELGDETDRRLVLVDVVAALSADDPLPPAVITGLRGLHSDSDRLLMLTAIAERDGGLRREAEATLLVTEAGGLHTDWARRQVLDAALERFPRPGAELSAAVRSLAERLESADERRDVLARLAPAR